jgi:hypothetical protein
LWKERSRGPVRAAAIALALLSGRADMASGQEGAAPRWGDRIAGVELWRIPSLPAAGRVIRENDVGGRPLRCAAAVRFDDRNDPQVTAIEFGIEIAPESPTDDEPGIREPRERAKMYVRVRLVDPRTGAPVAVARPIWHLERPISDAEWGFLPIDGEGFVRAEAPFAGASDRTLADAGADVAGQTALISMELPSGRAVRIVDIRGAGLGIDEYWELSRCVCDIDDDEIRYLGCRNVGWR